MRGNAVPNEVARKVITAHQQGLAYKLLNSDIESIGTGEVWNEAHADQASTELRRLVNQLHERGERVTVNTFDRHACAILHRTLDIPNNLVSIDGFWRWLAVAKFREIIEARHGDQTKQKPAHLRNYGIDASAINNRIAILWFRADMVYDPYAVDPYNLAKQPGHTDFWESGIIRHRYAWCRNLARAFVKFQYQDSSSDRAYLHSTSAGGVRELYKRLRRLHATVSYEFLSNGEVRQMLEDKSQGLKRAQE